jgi:hypothetical protein
MTKMGWLLRVVSNLASLVASASLCAGVIPNSAPTGVLRALEQRRGAAPNSSLFEQERSLALGGQKRIPLGICPTSYRLSFWSGEPRPSVESTDTGGVAADACSGKASNR